MILGRRCRVSFISFPGHRWAQSFFAWICGEPRIRQKVAARSLVARFIPSSKTGRCNATARARFQRCVAGHHVIWGCRR
jgi:hypothetical protein